MYEIVQVILIIIGAMFIIKGIRNVAKGYNIDKFLSMIIYKKSKSNKEMGK